MHVHRRAVLATSTALVGVAVMLAAWPVAAQSTLPLRARVTLLAADGVPTGLPAPDPAYCFAPGGSGSTPPGSIFGTLTVAGQPAPAGTIVQATFDGRPGVARFTAEAGGYRIDFDTGGESCINRAGAAIGVLLNGQVVATGKNVGQVMPGDPFRFDIALP
jgi:hypothetical protein